VHPAKSSRSAGSPVTRGIEVSFLRQLAIQRYCATAVLTAAFLAGLAIPASATDPMASNNGLLPGALEWQGRYNVANMDYPDAAISARPYLDSGPLTVGTAPEYALHLKAHLGRSLKVLIETPQDWDPVAAGWYDMVWSGDGTPGPDGVDPTSGREALMNSYSGQIMPPETFAPPYTPSAAVQNHAVIYYNSAAAVMLGRLWENIYWPDLNAIGFPEGSIVAKIEAVTNTPESWSVLDGTSLWHVYRPTTEAQLQGGKLTPLVIPVRPFQIALRIKDSRAAPETGWVFAAFVYDAKASGKTPWDRFVPVGLQWGNDPDQAHNPRGRTPGGTLQQSWINPAAPAFTHSTLGWGGRLAGPMDVATRHNVVTVSGRRFQDNQHLRASSCQSCHGAAEYPFTANLYPSPNRAFPRDGDQFLLYDPGSADWARWFQNRPGDQPMSGNIGGRGLDYDMALMFALSAYNDAIGNDGFVLQRFHVH
jgi:hypothetical protein